MNVYVDNIYIYIIVATVAIFVAVVIVVIVAIYRSARPHLPFGRIIGLEFRFKSIPHEKFEFQNHPPRPQRLKNMRKSNWIISPGVKTKKNVSNHLLPRKSTKNSFEKKN